MSKTISCLIIDDEPFARKGLRGYIEKVDFLELRGVCENALELNSLLKKEQADLLFLDIEMPYMTGIEFLRQLPAPPKVIFTTAYEKYALQGFELDVLDYLLKPISFERFLKSANKAFDYFRPGQPDSNGQADTVSAQAGTGRTGAQAGSAQAPATSQDYIFVKADNKLEKIVFSEILFVEAMQNYIGIYTTTAKRVIAHLTLKMLQEKLPPDRFIQPHKSYLVAMDKINSIEGNVLHILEYQVPVSKYQKEEVMAKIVLNKLLIR